MRKLIISLLMASAIGQIQSASNTLTPGQTNTVFYVGPHYTTIQACLTAAGVGGTCVVPNSIAVTGSSILMNLASQTLRCNPGVIITRGFNSDLINITGAGATVDGCILDGNQAGGYSGNSVIICQAAKCRITNNTVRNGSGYGIFVSTASGQIPGAIVTHNRVYGNLGIGIFGGIGASEALISLNTIDTTGATTSGAHGIALHSSLAGQNVSKSEVSKNTIYNGALNAFCVEVGAFSGDTPDSNVIANNSCKAVATNIAGGYSISGATNSVISGNTFTNNRLTLLLTNFIGGIEAAVDTDCTVARNTIVLGTPTGGQGITIDRTSKCSITGNSIHGWGPFSATAAGIKVSTVVASSNLNDNLLSGNILTCPRSGACVGIWIQCNNASANCNRNHVTGNHVFGNAVAGSYCYKTELDAGTMVSNVVNNNRGDSCATGLSITGGQTLPYSSNNIFSNTPTKFDSMLRIVSRRI
jgi:hypothetical protein